MIDRHSNTVPEHVAPKVNLPERVNPLKPIGIDTQFRNPDVKITPGYPSGPTVPEEVE